MQVAQHSTQVATVELKLPWLPSRQQRWWSWTRHAVPRLGRRSNVWRIHVNVVSQACSVIGTEGRIRDPQAGLVIAHRRDPPKDRSTISAGMAVFNQAVPGAPCLGVLRKALPRQLDLFARKLRKAGHLRVCCLTMSLRYRSTSRRGGIFCMGWGEFKQAWAK